MTGGSAGSAPVSRRKQRCTITTIVQSLLSLIDFRSQNDIYNIETKDRNSVDNFGSAEGIWS